MNITPEGKEIIERFKDLWDIHSLKTYPYCLDEDFPTWDKDIFDIKLFVTEIQFAKAEKIYHEKMLDYLINNKITEGNQQIYNQSQISRCQQQIKDKTEKLEVLKNKIQRKETQSIEK